MWHYTGTVSACNKGILAYLKHIIYSLLMKELLRRSGEMHGHFENVNKSTPQRGVLFPLLLILVVNDLLKEFEERGCQVVAYADDVAVLIKTKFLNTVYDLAKRYINVITNRAPPVGRLYSFTGGQHEIL